MKRNCHPFQVWLQSFQIYYLPEYDEDDGELLLTEFDELLLLGTKYWLTLLDNGVNTGAPAANIWLSSEEKRS
jgi:hypothetical protein